MTDHFAGAVARDYDDGGDPEFRPDVIARTVSVLAELADGAAALEFAVGTGRIAIPLHERGVQVRGFDLSPDMIAQLRAKAPALEADVGDMTSTVVAGEFTLVYLVFNTIGNLTTQDAQVACFGNAARHLAPGGRFVIEVGVPQLQRLAPGDSLLAFNRSDDHIGIDEYDVVDQGLISHHTRPRSGTTTSVPFRYVWPAELDLMARLAGLEREHRWADWDRSPFTATSTKHVSVWRKP